MLKELMKLPKPNLIKIFNENTEKYQGKFFKGYAPNFYFNKRVERGMKPFKLGG